MAAVLACGNGAIGPCGAPILSAWGAALSHRSAATLWELLPSGSGPIHVCRSGDGGRGAREGIRLHRSKTLSAGAVTLRRGIPVTTPARTIEDLRRVGPPRMVRRATRQAEIAGLLRGSAIETDRTRSDLERDFLRFCRRHDLPAPEVNVRIGRWTVDFLWPAQRVVVETDSSGYHRGSVAFEDDHARDLGLRALGYEVRRFTGLQIREKAAQVAADLRDALAPAS